VRLNRKVAVARVALATPGMNREPESALNRSRGLVATRVPVLLPSNQVCAYLEFVGVDVCTLARHLDVLHEEIVRVHTNCRSGVLERGHRQRTPLWVIRSAPGTLAANVIDDVSVLLALIRNIEDVRYRRRPSPAHATGAPRLRLPGGDGAILLNTNLHLRVVRRPRAGDHQLGVALVEHLYRFSARFL